MDTPFIHDTSSDDTHASGSDGDSPPSADVSGMDEWTPSMSPDSEAIAGSSSLATSNSGTLSEDPAVTFQRMVDEHLATASRVPLLGATEAVVESAETHISLATSMAQASRPPSPRSDDQWSASASSSSVKDAKQPTDPPEAVSIQEGEPLAAYTCPICFSAPSHATITPCGHILCGECLFTAVKTSIQRSAYTLPHGEHNVARYVSSWSPGGIEELSALINHPPGAQCVEHPSPGGMGRVEELLG